MDHELLASSCYNLEGNEVLIVFAYECLQALMVSLDRSYDLCPLVFEFIDALPDEEKDAWIEKFEAIMAPLRLKLRTKISEIRPDPDANHFLKANAEFSSIMAMKCARFFNPTYISGMRSILFFLILRLASHSRRSHHHQRIYSVLRRTL